MILKMIADARMVASNMCILWLMPKELIPANSGIAFKAPAGFRVPSEEERSYLTITVAIQSTFPDRRIG
jgi:hypothetical protein